MSRSSLELLLPFSAKDIQLLQKIALTAAVEAGKIQSKNFRKKIRIQEKDGAGLVTEVDLRSEEIIIRHLRKFSRDLAIIGEESGHSREIKQNEPVWHVDPLDGTTNYAHGFPMYGISIGMAIGNIPLLGVVHAPTLKETWHAVSGNGAFHGKQRMYVSRRSKIKNCLLATGFAYTKGAPLRDAIERFRQLSARSRAVRRPGAAALDLAYLAMGVYDGFWERDLKSWDMCAGVCLVREAGGIITNFHDKPFRFSEGEILGSNGLIHASMVRIMKVPIKMKK